MKKREKKTSVIKEMVTLAQVEDRLMTIRDQRVLLDSDVAALYAVETREVNQAIQRNPDKFPEGYVIQLDKLEWQGLKSKFLTSNKNELIKNFDNSEGQNIRSQIVILENKKELITNCDKFPSKHFPGTPNAFTEKGLYMLATILKGERAVQTTLAIVETFAKIRELARTVSQLADTNEKFKQQSLMQKSGEIMADILGDGVKATDSETSVEINLAVLKFKHIVRRKTET